jgi:enamine deaminase RidA (YjgF/YER057c/UK114 family)
MIETRNSPKLPEPAGFTHASIATGTKMVHLAGQISQDSEGNLVGEGDLAAQTEQAMLNVAAVMEAVGGSVTDIVKTTLYVVDWNESKMEDLITGFGKAAAQLGGAALVPVTLVSVGFIFREGFLIEIDSTAVLD